MRMIMRKGQGARCETGLIMARDRASFRPEVEDQRQVVEAAVLVHVSGPLCQDSCR